MENLHRYTVRDSYLNRTGSLLVNRTVLGFQIPYGTWEIYIAKYRTGLSFEPYGITFIRPLRTTLHLPPVRDINLHRTVCSFFRLRHHVVVNFSAVLQHEIVLTFKYVTLVTLCFSSDFPALALSPPVQTHTVRDFQPNFYHRTVFLFLFFSYRTG